MLRAALVPLLLCLVLVPAGAAAQEAPPITSSRYGLEISQGPITSASRVVGLAGAFTALAEWCEGVYANAASPASRAPYSSSSFDYDICLGLTSPGAFAGTDFENREAAYPSDPAASRFRNSITTNLGLQLQFGRFGVTVNYDGATYGLDRSSAAGDAAPLGAATRLRLDRVTAAVAWSLFDGQLLLGVGSRALIVGLEGSGAAPESAAVGTQAGAGYQVGAILRPNDAPYRLGFTLRGVVGVSQVGGALGTPLEDGSVVASGLYLPERISAPFEAEIGAAWAFGPRPLNPYWIDAEDILAPQRRAVDEARVRRALAYEEALAQLPEGAAREAERRRRERAEEAIVAREEADLARRRERVLKGLKAREGLRSRQGITVHATVLLLGTTVDAVGLSGFLLQRREPYGSFVTASPRVGFEMEAIPHRLTLRGGTYFEPSRFEGGVPRVHGTAGADVALFRFTGWGLFADNPWRLRLAFDAAPRYSNFAVAIGQYH